MKATIKISKTYEEVTPESAEYGEAEDQGFEYEAQEFTFRELVDEIEYYSEKSSSGEVDEHTWLIECCGITDYSTCTETSYGYHFADVPAKVKYWIKAVAFVDARKRAFEARLRSKLA